MNFEKYLPPKESRRGRFEKLRPTSYAISSVLKPLFALQKSRNPDAVFLWIPRTGGTSFFTALKSHGCPQFKRLDQIHYRFTNRGLATFSHLDYPALLREGFVTASFDESAYKFAVVRNPYDRTVSLFHYFIKKGDLHPKTSFATFCQLLAEEAIDEIGLFNVNGMSQCQPQSKWLVNGEGKMIANFVGKYETLTTSFKNVMTHLKLSAELPHVNATVHEPWRNHYTPELLEIVGNFYAEDFELFEYERL